MKISKSIATAGICLLLPLAGNAQTTEGARDFNATNSSQVVKVHQYGSGFGAKASTPSSGSAAAFFGHATAKQGSASGVFGVSNSPNSAGVRGQSAGIGAFGFTTSTSGTGVFGDGGGGDASGNSNSVGVLGQVCSGGGPYVPPAVGCTQGFPVGVLGRDFGFSGAAAVFEVNAQGGANLIVGHQVTDQTLNIFRVDSGGAVFASSYNTGGADFAESVAVEGVKSSYSPGDVLVIDQESERRLTRAAEPYSTLVAGIYSTKPGLLASPYKIGEVPKTEVPLAVIGIVPCKVTSANGPIKAGDLLVTSSRAGYAMKGTDRNKMMGAILGKALQPLAEGDGTIQVLVTLQ